MKVRDLLSKLAGMPDDVLVLIEDDSNIVFRPTSVEHVAHMDDYSCAGFSDEIENLDEVLGEAVVIK